MSDLLPVELVFHGHPFDAAAVAHTLRHLAMRVGWQLVPCSQYRVLYATEAYVPDIADRPTCVVVPSSPAVGEHLRHARTPFPVARGAEGRLLPFPHETSSLKPGSLPGDVLAGAHACLSLWYERRSQPAAADGWITYEQDWMAHIGMSDPLPLADEWLDLIYDAAVHAGWPATRPRRHFAVVLTHDVDYLPGRKDRGFPRLARALYRQTFVRRKPLAALALVWGYLRAVGRSRPPYFEIPSILDEEARRGARSSFQFVVARRHRSDPAYAPAAHGPLEASREGRLAEICNSVPAGWEICLHGSLLASRTPGQLAAERARLDVLARRPVRGYRQHYLSFEPSGLFQEVAKASLCYDMSVGYNDRSGPRAGTYFPFRPYDPDARECYEFWEIPFVLMDTTLATTYRFAPAEALAHCKAVLQPVAAAGGCVSLIWHQEQCGGLLDPGYERVYFDLLDWLVAQGARLTSGAALLPELDAAWSNASKAE